MLIRYPRVCQHADKIQIIGVIGTENDVTFRHMSAHVGMLPGVDTCRHICADILTVTFSPLDTDRFWLYGFGNCELNVHDERNACC